MGRARLQQLKDDGIVDMDQDFLNTALPAAWKNAVTAIKDDPTKVKFGDLTITELTSIITVVTATP